MRKHLDAEGRSFSYTLVTRCQNTNSGRGQIVPSAPRGPAKSLANSGQLLPLVCTKNRQCVPNATANVLTGRHGSPMTVILAKEAVVDRAEVRHQTVTES